MPLSKSKEDNSNYQIGQFETPYETANFMVQSALKYFPSPSSVLEPAVGNGIFVQALFDNGINPNIINCHDIDDDVVNTFDMCGVCAKKIDSIIDNYPKYDFIIGNP